MAAGEGKHYLDKQYIGEVVEQIKTVDENTNKFIDGIEYFVNEGKGILDELGKATQNYNNWRTPFEELSQQFYRVHTNLPKIKDDFIQSDTKMGLIVQSQSEELDKFSSMLDAYMSSINENGGNLGAAGLTDKLNSIRGQYINTIATIQNHYVEKAMKEVEDEIQRLRGEGKELSDEQLALLLAEKLQGKVPQEALLFLVAKAILDKPRLIEMTDQELKDEFNKLDEYSKNRIGSLENYLAMNKGRKRWSTAAIESGESSISIINKIFSGDGYNVKVGIGVVKASSTADIMEIGKAKKEKNGINSILNFLSSEFGLSGSAINAKINGVNSEGGIRILTQAEIDILYGSAKIGGTIDNTGITFGASIFASIIKGEATVISIPVGIGTIEGTLGVSAGAAGAEVGAGYTIEEGLYADVSIAVIIGGKIQVAFKPALGEKDSINGGGWNEAV